MTAMSTKPWKRPRPTSDALERYERRAWSRQMRAFGDFMDIKCVLDQNRVMEKIS